MTYEQLQDEIWNWAVRHKKAICYIAGVVGTFCFMVEAFNVIQ